MPIRPASWLWERLPWKPQFRFCRGQEVNVSARDLLPRKSCCMCYPGGEDKVGTLLWRLIVQRGHLFSHQTACHFLFSCLQNPCVIITKNSDVHTENCLWQTFLTTKLRSFFLKMKKDKQHCFLGMSLSSPPLHPLVLRKAISWNWIWSF